MQTIFESNPYFKEALRKVNFRIDEASKQNVEIFGKTWAEKHFTYGNLPHLSKDFKTLLGKMHLTIAASTINGRSAEPLRMNQGFEELAQKMFTHAHAYKMEADYIRDLMLRAKAAVNVTDEQIVDYLVNEIFDQQTEAVMGVRARMDIIILEALSNHGQFTFTKDNDPQSPFIGTTIGFGFDPKKKGSVEAGKEWTDAHKATIDPISEIDSVLKQNRLIKPKKILTDYSTLLYMESCDKMKGYLNTTLYPNDPISETKINSWLAEHNLPTIEVVDFTCGVQDGDDVKDYTPWKEGQLVFIPQDKLGTIETSYSDAELGMKSDGVKYNHYGRIETRRFVQGEKENSDYAEITKASMTGAPSFVSAKNIITLDTKKNG
jgi:hypothetical protein